MLALVQEAAPHLVRREQAVWAGRLEAEIDNIRAALDWCLAHNESGLGAHILWSLYWFWMRSGRIAEGRR